jgi:hypothetical protein
VCFGNSHKEVGNTKRDGCATGRNPPLKHCIQLLVKKLETKGTLLDLHGGGRPEMSENTVHDIANRLLASPRKSPSMYYRKKLDYQEARVKEQRARAGCSPVTHQACMVCSCRHTLLDDPTGKSQVGSNLVTLEAIVLMKLLWLGKMIQLQPCSH